MWFGPGEMKKGGWDEAAIMIKGEDLDLPRGIRVGE